MDVAHPRPAGLTVRPASAQMGALRDLNRPAVSRFSFVAIPALLTGLPLTADCRTDM